MVFGMKIQMRHFWPFSNSVHLVTEDKLTSPVVHDFALKVFFGIKCPTTRIDFVSGSFLGKLVHGKLRLVTINGKIVMTCKNTTESCKRNDFEKYSRNLLTFQIFVYEAEFFEPDCVVFIHGPNRVMTALNL